MIGDTARPVAMLKRKTPPAEADGETNYEKMNAVVRDSMIGHVFKEKPRQPKPTGFYFRLHRLITTKRRCRQFNKSLLGWAQENPTCARPTMGGGVLMLPPASLGVPPPHPLVGVHKTSPFMTNKNHSKAHFFLARCGCSQNNSFCEHCCLHQMPPPPPVHGQSAH